MFFGESRGSDGFASVFLQPGDGVEDEHLFPALSVAVDAPGVGDGRVDAVVQVRGFATGIARVAYGAMASPLPAQSKALLRSSAMWA